MTTSDDNPLLGATTLRINHATAIKALQHYFDAEVFKRPGAAYVISVTLAADQYFEIHLSSERP